jgi:hypothetical protein
MAKGVYEKVVFVSTAISFVVSFAIVVALAVVTAWPQLRGEVGSKSGSNGLGIAKRLVERIDERRRMDPLRGRLGSPSGE